MRRCQWAGSDPDYVSYHDTEWGVPVYDDRRLFEMLVLEGAQAGLSWITILKKRAHYRRVFDGFDPQKIASYNKRKLDALLKDPGIIRNRLKIQAAVSNAQAFLDFRERRESFSDYLWQFVDHQPVNNHWHSEELVPATTVQAEGMSRSLKKSGFKFVGPVICYAFMQSVGMVNDHVSDCFRYREISRLNRCLPT